MAETITAYIADRDHIEGPFELVKLGVFDGDEVTLRDEHGDVRIFSCATSVEWLEVVCACCGRPAPHVGPNEVGEWICYGGSGCDPLDEPDQNLPSGSQPEPGGSSGGDA